jgi:hypothetical protein
VGLLDAVHIERSIELTLKPAEDVALGPPMSDQVERGFAVTRMAKVRMEGECLCVLPR